jgi:hypothetical protein
MNLCFNPNWMAGGVKDSQNFEQIQLKAAGSKNILYPLSIPHKIF